MSRRLLATILAAVLLAVGEAQLMRRDSSKRDAGSSRLRAVLREALQEFSAERLMHIEESLRPSYEAFPKDARGNLPPHRVLPALVRAYFAKEHGWLLRGLESPGAPIISPGETFTTARAPSPDAVTGEVFQTHIWQDKAPELVAALEEVTYRPVHASAGLSFGDVVQIVATLEQLLLKESLQLLRAAYFLNGLDVDSDNQDPSPIEESELHEVLQSYLLLFRHGLPRNLTDVKGHARMKARARRTSDWKGLTSFESQAVSEEAMPQKDSSGKLSWDTVSKTTQVLAQRFGNFQNSECHAFGRP